MEKKKLIADEIYYPHANQMRIHHDNHRYRVVVAGRRFGKSALAINEALAWIMDKSKPNQMVWIILPEYQQAEKIYWIDPDITKYYMPYVQAGKLKKNDNKLSLKCIETGSYLFLIGSNNADSLRGSGLDLIIWDEVADVKPSAFDVISPTLADSPHHRVMYMGTPDGFNHFHDYALRGDHDGLIERAGKSISLDEEWQTFKFTSYDNMTWDIGSIERTSFVNYLNKERQKYIEMGQEDWFEQEYMAEFRKRAGAVHKLFARTMHVIPFMQIPHTWVRERGWDWGSSHPTASVRVATDQDDNWFIEICYKQKDKTIEQHAQMIKIQDTDFLEGKITNSLEETRTDPIPGYGDPSGRQWISEFNKLGFSIKAAKKSQNTEKKTWLEMAIDKINSKIAPKKGHTVFLPNGVRLDDAPSFFILNTPENQDLVEELETLSYKKESDGLVKTELDDTQDRKGHYDLHASLRYYAISTGNQLSYGATNAYEVVKQRDQVVPETKDLRNPLVRAEFERQADLELIRAQNREAMANSRW